MQTVEIVSHAWAERFPIYAAALTYQLSSLVLHPPQKCRVSVAVCCTLGDARVAEVIANFYKRYKLDIRTVLLDVPSLGRRAIGRNAAAKSTEADIVWFADVDYVFGHDCLDALAVMEWPDDVSIVFPKRIKIQCDHATGDKELEFVLHRSMKFAGIVGVLTDQFVDHTHNRAIGGVQIVRGDLARRHGYLDGHAKWQKPLTDGKMFHTSEDMAFRRQCKEHGRAMGIELPNVFRMRHSECCYETREQHVKGRGT